MEYLGHTIEILRNPMPWNIPTYQICGNIKTHPCRRRRMVSSRLCALDQGKSGNDRLNPFESRTHDNPWFIIFSIYIYIIFISFHFSRWFSHIYPSFINDFGMFWRPMANPAGGWKRSRLAPWLKRGTLKLCLRPFGWTPRWIRSSSTLNISVQINGLISLIMFNLFSHDQYQTKIKGMVCLVPQVWEPCPDEE